MTQQRHILYQQTDSNRKARRNAEKKANATKQTRKIYPLLKMLSLQALQIVKNFCPVTCKYAENY
jgi:hypothetical protein